MSTERVYVRCNSGHYFQGSACPFDGWSMEHLNDLTLALLRLEDSGERLTLSGLADHGAPAKVLARTIVIEFGSEEAAFEALDPSGFILNGEWTLLRAAPPSLK